MANADHSMERVFCEMSSSVFADEHQAWIDHDQWSLQYVLLVFSTTTPRQTRFEAAA